MKKWIMLLFVMLFAGLVDAARFSNSSGDGLWGTPENWTGGVVPDSTISAQFNYGGSHGYLDYDAGEIKRLQLGDNEPGYLTIQDGGKVVSLGGWSGVGYNRKAGLYIEEGGELICNDYFAIGLFDDKDDHVCELVLDGRLEVNNAFHIGLYYDGKQNGNPVNHSAKATINGVLDVYDFPNIKVNCQMDVRLGTVIVNGDITNQVATWESEGKVLAFGGLGDLNIDYGTINPGRTTITATSPLNPSPEHKEEIIPGMIDLTWTNFDYVDSDIDVWFGRTKEPNQVDPSDTYSLYKIIDASTGAAKVATIEVDASDLGDYFWRVDTYPDGYIANDPNLIVGDVFQFTSSNNFAPTVDAGLSVITWLTDGKVDIQLDATATDEDLASLAFQWAPTDNVDISFSDAEIEDPVVTVNATGSYTLEVTVTDNADQMATDDLVVTVYSDACEAAQDQDGYMLIGDLDDDCDVDLADFALVAADWLKDLTLAEPILIEPASSEE